MNEVQVKVLQETFEHFGDELAGLLSDGWQVMYQQVIYVDKPDGEETYAYVQEPQMLAILRRGGNEPVRGQAWMLGAIEGLQVRVLQLEAMLKELDHVLDIDLSGIGATKDEAANLMDEQLLQAISEGYTCASVVDEPDDLDIEGWHDVHMEFWTPEDMQAYIKFNKLNRVELIDAEIARDLAAGVG